MINEDDLWNTLDLLLQNGNLIGVMAKQLPEEFEDRKVYLIEIFNYFLIIF